MIVGNVLTHKIDFNANLCEQIAKTRLQHDHAPARPARNTPQISRLSDFCISPFSLRRVAPLSSSFLHPGHVFGRQPPPANLPAPPYVQNLPPPPNVLPICLSVSLAYRFGPVCIPSLTYQLRRLASRPLPPQRIWSGCRWRLHPGSHSTSGAKGRARQSMPHQC